MKPYRGPPMTLGDAARAHVRLSVRCRREAFYEMLDLMHERRKQAPGDVPLTPTR
jgi:hypothetical protein